MNMNRPHFSEKTLAKVRVVWILLPAFFFLSALWAQTLPPQERFRHLTIDDGLSQNAVQVIHQSPSGFLWIGTKDGLNRYDGYEFKVFQHNPADKASLSNNFILDIFEGHGHQLWIGTKNGLNKYDAKTESFESLNFSQLVTGADPNVPVSSITQDQNGNIWLAIKGKNLVKLHFKDDAVDPNRPILVSSAFKNIYHLHHDGEHIWVGDQSGLFRFDVSGKEISRHAIFTRKPEAARTKMDSSVTYIIDSQDPKFLWLGTASGICHFEKNTGKYEFYPNHYEERRYGWGVAQTILADPISGKLWIGTASELMRFDPATKNYEYFYSRPYTRYGFHGAGILSSAMDRSQQLWFGTNGYGINIFDSRQTGIKTLIHQIPESSRLRDFSIRAIFKDKDDNVWISASVLYRWDRNAGKITSYEVSPDRVEAMGNTSVWSVIQDHEGWLWFAANEGLYRHRLEDSTVLFYKHIEGSPTTLPEREAYHVYQDKKQRIWAVTRNYICLMDRETGRFSSIKYRDNNTVEPSFVRIVEDGDGKFWMNSEIGLLRFDPDSGSIQAFQHSPQNGQSISSNIIRSICPDPKEPEKYLWLGTAGGGLNKFDITTKQCRRITTQDGLPDNVIYSVLATQDGYLWMSTNKGLSRFCPASFTFKNFDIKDGLQSNEFNSGAYHQSEDGELFFGGIQGLNYFYPDQLTVNAHIPEIQITGLQIGSRRIFPGDSTGILLHSIGEQKEIKLDYKENIITFSFAAMDFTAPEKNRFRYKLEGWDRNWVEAGTRRTATYTNLPAGNYTFRVLGSNNDGVWNETGASVRILITPPFWLSWWAKSVYFLLFLALIYAIASYHLKRAKLRHQLAIETVEKKKLQELDQLKSKFFTNISHELRTPLTLIAGPLSQLRYSLKDAAALKTLEVMERNVNQLLAMVNQILDLSRLEMGKEQLREKEGDLIPFLRGIAMSYQSLAESRNIRLSCSSALSAAIGNFDHQKIEQIVINLLSNAIKYSSAGDEVALIIEGIHQTNKVDNQKALFTFSVVDTGPGIAEAHLGQIFQRYYRIEGQHEGQVTGSGIGLAIVKELVELHGGKIEAERTSGGGATFRVCLPLRLAYVERNGVEAAGARPQGTITPQHTEKISAELIDKQSDEKGRNMVLIIEDNADVRNFITQVLSPEFIALESQNGADGILKARELIPDLIITDVMMPGMNGYEVCSELTNNPLTSHIPVIMLTAKSAQDDRLEGFSAGADAYITKPFKSEELLLRSRMLIEKRLALQKRHLAPGPASDKAPYRNATESAFIHTVMDTLQLQLSDPGLDVSAIADAVHMSDRQLRRKFQAVFGQSPNQFIRTFRLRKAHELLRSGAGNVSEICFEVGFNNVSYFSKCFREEFGISPSEVS